MCSGELTQYGNDLGKKTRARTWLARARDRTADGTADADSKDAFVIPTMG